ncbi:MAG TPA: winged helix-turn-helix domain-containing protein [Arsenophonus sp.]
MVELEKFDEEIFAVLHNPDKSSQTEIGYHLAWARTYLKKAGYLENSSCNVWALTGKVKQTPKINSREIANFVRLVDRKNIQSNIGSSDPVLSVDASPEETFAWRENRIIF